MAYMIQCHVVDPKTEKIIASIDFYGEDAEEAQNNYAECFATPFNLAELDEKSLLVVDEGEIDDADVPEIEPEG